MDCSIIPNLSTSARGGHTNRIMVERQNQVCDHGDKTGPQYNQSDVLHTHVNYYKIWNEEDPFPDMNLLDPLDQDQREQILSTVQDMIQTAIHIGLSDEYMPSLKIITSPHVNIFRVSFSAGPPAKIPPLKIDLTPNNFPVRFRLRRYPQGQKHFLLSMVSDLVKHKMSYAKSASPCALAPVLVAEPGAENLRFTVDLRPVNSFTIRYQFPMPNIDHELLKLSHSMNFAPSDLIHWY